MQRLKTSSFIAQNFKQKFIEKGKGYKSDHLDKHISTIEKVERNETLKLGKSRNNHILFH